MFCLVAGQVGGVRPADAWSVVAEEAEGRTVVVVLPELDGTGSRSGSAGRDGPGTDGRGLVGVVGGTGVGTGLVGVGAVPPGPGCA
ncbi:hypothetical protein ACQP2Y_06645 [Actinoplanes sp. CA-051413]|uniref:hypothetical protein n=1 Tax=Actinoplanes sp. CA-051413 TaxID=3239899 RepID=UPI003D97131D